MIVEIEIKLKVDGFSDVRKLLKEKEGRFLHKVLETTCHYDYPDQRLRNMDSVLRVRTNQVLEGNPLSSCVAYKGPRIPGRMKSRQEIETELPDPGKMKSILEAIGIQPLMSIEKKRESWQLGKCRVELDEIPYLGTFVEIEGPDETTIEQAQADLGLSQLCHIEKGYISLLHEYASENNLPTDHIGFKE